MCVGVGKWGGRLGSLSSDTCLLGSFSRQRYCRVGGGLGGWERGKNPRPGFASPTQSLTIEGGRLSIVSGFLL